MRVELPKELIPFPYQTGTPGNGVYAQFDAQGDLRHIGYYNDGLLMDGVDVPITGKPSFTHKEYYFSGPDDPDFDGVAGGDFDVAAYNAALGSSLSQREFDALPEAEQQRLVYKQGLIAMLSAWMNQLIPAHHAASGESVPSCNFCEKLSTEVNQLIAGPSVYICNECVERCNEIIA